VEGQVRHYCEDGKEPKKKIAEAMRVREKAGRKVPQHKGEEGGGIYEKKKKKTSESVPKPEREISDGGGGTGWRDIITDFQGWEKMSKDAQKLSKGKRKGISSGGRKVNELQGGKVIRAEGQNIPALGNRGRRFNWVGKGKGGSKGGQQQT